jgi:hypothetical protein
VKYMLLIYQNTDAWQALAEADRTAVMNEATAIFEELNASGEAIGGDALAPPSATKTVKVRDGVPAVTDGPFIESKEQFVGYLTVDVKSEERAVEIAKRWPDARYWVMEVRPILSMDE